MSTTPEAVPSATTVPVAAASAALVRDSPSGLEVLLLRRTTAASFAPGAWVFPGGKVDPEDHATADDPADVDGDLPTARRAAARETAEEAGLTIDPAALRPLAQWVPPVTAPRRFRTWILIGAAPERGDVQVDGAEIIDHRWLRPADAMSARDRGELTLLPPTWVTLWELARHPDVATALANPARPELFETRIARVAGGPVALWHGDAGYLDGDAGRAGPRHRLWMADAGWRYERSTTRA